MLIIFTWQIKMTTVSELLSMGFINSLNSNKMNKFSINSLLILGLAFISTTALSQYLSMRVESPKLDKFNKNIFQVPINQEVNSNLNFRILVNNPNQELVNFTLKDQ